MSEGQSRISKRITLTQYEGDEGRWHAKFRDDLQPITRRDLNFAERTLRVEFGKYHRGKLLENQRQQREEGAHK